jgi:hypothetical protein
MGKGFMSGARSASPIINKVLPVSGEAAKDALIKSPAGSIPPGGGEGFMGKLGQLAGQYAGSKMSNPYATMISDLFEKENKPKMQSVYGGKGRERVWDYLDRLGR